MHILNFVLRYVVPLISPKVVQTWFRGIQYVARDNIIWEREFQLFKTLWLRSATCVLWSVEEETRSNYVHNNKDLVYLYHITVCRLLCKMLHIAALLIF